MVMIEMLGFFKHSRAIISFFKVVLFESKLSA